MYDIDLKIIFIYFCYIGAYITIYSSCIPKGRVHMPFSLREMIERVKYSKVKLYKGVDVDLKVHTNQLYYRYFLVSNTEYYVSITIRYIVTLCLQNMFLGGRRFPD